MSGKDQRTNMKFFSVGYKPLDLDEDLVQASPVSNLVSQSFLKSALLQLLLSAF